MAFSDRRIAVVGAGAAGLVSAREMRRGGFDVTVYEQSNRVGGIWAYTPETSRASGKQVWSSIYESLRTNLPRDIKAFLDYTFDSRGGGDDAWPRFPHHSRVLEYLERFSRDFDVLPLVRFDSTVREVKPLDHGRWQIEVESGGVRQSAQFDAVMVCNGHYAAPRIPPLPGIEHFDGEVLHSHDYRTPALFKDKTVALWGSSASGADISLELSSVARAIYWCGNAFDKAPEGREIRRGIRAFPSPTGFDADGRLMTRTDPPLEIDVFMYCTGYEYDFPFLDETIIRVEDNRVHPLYQQLLNPTCSTLAFIGIPFLIVPFPLFEIQAKWFRALLEGRVRLPEKQEMLRIIEADHQEQLTAGLRQRHSHRLGEAQSDYYALLAAQCGEPPLPDWFAATEHAAREARLKDPAGFRESIFPVTAPTVVTMPDARAKA